MADRGPTAVAVVTQEFEALSRIMAANAGRKGLRIHVLPYPLETEPEETVRRIAREHFALVLDALGAEA